ASVGEIQGLLQNAASAAEVDEILNATVRPQDGSAWIGANTVAGQTVTIAMQRLASVRGSDVMMASAGESGRAAGVAYARSEEGSRRVWGQVFGQMATQDQRQGIAGYDSHTSGVVFG